MRVRLNIGFAALAASFFLLAAAVASAQMAPAGSASTQPATGTAAAAMAETDVVAVPVWPKAAIPLPEQPVAASFQLGQIQGVAPQLISGVTAKGYARKVAVENETIGQVLVVSVAKGDREETISTEGLTAQFDAKTTSELFPEKNFEVKGSKAALVAALERLAQTKKDDGQKKAEKDSVADNPVSGGKSSNNEAAGYKTPTIAATPATQEKDPVIDVRTSTEGCPVRIDTAQGKAVRQSKEQTFSDGTLSSEGQCTDSEVSFVLKKSYTTCPTDIVDLEAKTAWPQFSWYYIDDAGENHPVGECAKDAETSYVVTEDESQCRIYLDFNAHQAVPQSAMVYIGRNNALTQVPGHGCAASTKSTAVPMTESTANCPLRPDYAAGLNYELSMWTYVRGGVTYQAAPCADTGRTFVHQTIYADASGNYICPTVPNLTTKTVTLQSRKQITVDGVPQYITDCTPDVSPQAILSTTNGCMDPSKWTHDLDAGISYGQERFYYKKADGTPEYVTPCQNSTVTYPHDETVTGYQDHDDQLWAYPLSTVTITVNGAPFTVASSEVLPGAAQLSYVLEGTIDQATGQSTYDGCSAYRTTGRFEQWKRPDNTEYLKQTGPGNPTGPVNVCVSTVIDSRYLQTGVAGSNVVGIVTAGEGGNTVDYTYYVQYNMQTVNKIVTKNTETGAAVATTCGFANNNWQGSISTVSYYNTVPPLPCRLNGGPGYIFCPVGQTLTIPPCPF
jgi:hypothetical protein